jgi:hypothetical protein
MKKPSFQFILRSVEILVAVIFAFGFRMFVDWLLAPLPLGNWIILIRWLLLILFIGFAIRLHAFIIALLKKRGVLTGEIW